MADTIKIVADEIAVTIKQTFDDKEVSRAQIVYWLTITANDLLGKHNMKRDSGAFMTTFAAVPVKVASANSKNIKKGAKYIELPGFIFDFDQDGGVEYIAYYNDAEECGDDLGRKTIQRTSPSQLQWLDKSLNTRPSPRNPYWYRSGNIIYLRGIEKVPVKMVEMGIYMTIDPLEKIDINQPFNFPQELMKVLKMQVVDLARYSFLFPADRSNDGDDTASEGKPNIPKIISVNDQQQA